MKQVKEFSLTHLTFIKVLLVGFMALIGFFITKENAWSHWSWLLYGLLFISYLIAEFIQHKQSMLSPLERVRAYLLDFDGWEEVEENNWHYKAHPEFMVCPTKEDLWEVQGSENWVRAATNPKAFVRPMQIKYNGTPLIKIPCIYFDEMRGFIPAPKATFIKTSETQFFWSLFADEFDFILLQFLLRRTEKKIFDEGILDPRAGRIPVVVFSSKDEKKSFAEWALENPIQIEDRHTFIGMRNDPLISDHDRNIITYSRAVMEALEKYRNTKR